MDCRRDQFFGDSPLEHSLYSGDLLVGVFPCPTEIHHFLANCFDRSRSELSGYGSFVEFEELASGGYSMFSYRESVDGLLVAIVMPDMVDAGAHVVTVTERFKGAF